MYNMAVCKDQDADDVWYIANNLDESITIREYKKNTIIGVVKNLNGIVLP